MRIFTYVSFRIISSLPSSKLYFLITIYVYMPYTKWDAFFGVPESGPASCTIWKPEVMKELSYESISDSLPSEER
jgi:hypothetical protein